MAINLKQRGVDLLRRTGLLAVAENIRYRRALAFSRQENITFRNEHPAFIPPPLAAMHDAYGGVSFRYYQESGIAVANIVANLILKHHPKLESVLEWGCGPARVIRHLPNLLPRETRIFGADYNPESIGWCKLSIKNIVFDNNNLSPPLPYADKTFDVIYAMSVLTHLSTEQQDDWIRELRRILRPKGILILTTHGKDSAERVLSPPEYKRFQAEGVVIRGGVKEGKRCFASYHHPTYATDHLFADLEVLEHTSEKQFVGQDIWVLRELS